MEFKVGDIIRFTGEGFVPFVYGKDHIITRMTEWYIVTQGHGWDYRDFGWDHDVATTNKNGWRKLTKAYQKSWSDSKLTFKFINTDII